LHILKTGNLIMSSARCGSIIGSANSEQLTLITEYAKNIGLAFQVIDDISDGDGFVEFLNNKEDAFEYARTLTLEALLKLETLNKEYNINTETLKLLAKYLLYRDSRSNN